MAVFPSDHSDRISGVDAIVSFYTESISAPAQERTLAFVWVAGAYLSIGYESAVTVYAGEEFGLSGTDTWYEIIHVFPLSIDAGNVLTAQQYDLSIYNADRFSSRTVSSFTNNAGEGVTITDLPSLPLVLDKQEGIDLTLEISPNGPPTIDGLLVFDFDVAYDGEILITGSRIVLLPFVPETPVEETLEFLTDILTRKDGSEQRINLRKNPRQGFNLVYLREEGTELSRFDILLFGWQSRAFGLPTWTEAADLSAPASSGSFTVNVESTEGLDLRVGELATVWEDESTFDALAVASFTATSVTFDTALSRSYSRNAILMPVRTAVVRSNPQGTRYAVNLATRRLSLEVLANEVGDAYASAGTFLVDDASSVIDGEVLVDLPNVIRGQLTEGHVRDIQFFDNETGAVSFATTVPFNLRTSPLTILTQNRAELLRFRKLLHFLKGRQKSFFVPTDFRDVIVSQTVVNGSGTVTIENVGYSRYAQQQGRYLVVRVELTDGTTYDAEVTNSAELSAAEEQLTLSRLAPREIAPSEFRRISFLERVRIDSDRIPIVHQDANGQTIITVALRGVIE